MPLTFIAGMGYFAIGKVDVSMLVALLIGSIPGIIAGSFLAPKLPEKVLRVVLAVMLELRRLQAGDGGRAPDFTCRKVNSR